MLVHDAQQIEQGETPTLAGDASGAGVLRRIGDQLRAILADSEREIRKLAQDFEGLARETNAILETAATIIACAESERMASVLPRVQTLGEAAQGFIRQRLGSTEGILETVAEEAAHLDELAQLTQGQRAVVKETGMLRLLTNIEVARLGEVGAGFQYLAVELDDFSQTVGRSTSELTVQTEDRRKAIEETRRTLARELPRMREDYARIVESLGGAQSLAEATVMKMCEISSRFRSCVEEVASRIAGVVAAIQGHDITRQQIEHVVEGLETIAADLERPGSPDGGATKAAVTIQSYQLRMVRQTVEGWVSQIGNCLDGISRIASAEILNLSAVVLEQERTLTEQLTRIERLEKECEAEDARVQASFAGVAGLMQLVNEHLAGSRSVRDRLQLLMFNSIVEASHLGTQADAILEISKTIKRISAAWGEITTNSEAATARIGALVEWSGATLEAFSESSYAGLRQASQQTEGGLEILREAAQLAARAGREIETAVQALQTRIAETSGAAERLETCFRRLSVAEETIGSARREEDARFGGSGGFDAGALEERFSAGYTTEIEREVLRAALAGGPLPVVKQSFTGNCVELF